MTTTTPTIRVSTEDGDYKHGGVHMHYDARYGQVFCDVDHAYYGDE